MRIAREAAIAKLARDTNNEVLHSNILSCFLCGQITDSHTNNVKFKFLTMISILSKVTYPGISNDPLWSDWHQVFVVGGFNWIWFS